MGEDTGILAQDKAAWWNERLFLTEWQDVDAPQGRRAETTWGLFYERRLVQYPVVEAKSDLPGWSPATFQGDYRKLARVERVSALVLDLEPPKRGATQEGATLEQIHEAWAPVGHLLHSSYSHRLLGIEGPEGAPPLPRNCFRLILPLGRPVLAEEYRRLARWAYQRHAAAQIPTDTGASDPSRLWFVPAARPGEGPILVGTCWVERLLDPDAILQIPEPPRPEPEVPQLTVGATDNPAYVRSAVEQAVQAIFEAPEGDRNNLLNKQAFSLGGLVGAGALSESEVVMALLGATRAAGWDKPLKNEACIRRAIKDGKERPRVVKAPLPSTYRPEARVSYLDHQAPLAAPPEAPPADEGLTMPTDQEVKQAIVSALQGLDRVDEVTLLFKTRTSFPTLIRPGDDLIRRLADELIEEEVLDISDDGDYWLIVDPNEVADRATLQGMTGGAEPPAPPPDPPGGGGDEPPQEPERPTVRLGSLRINVLDATLDAMGQTRAFYQREGRLVEPVREWVSTRDGRRRYARMVVKNIHNARLEELLLRNIDFERYDAIKRENKPANPPIWLMQQLYNRGQWDTVLPLRGVAEAPVLRPDGTLLCKPGYDEDTALMYQPNAEYLPVTDTSPEAVQQAKEKLFSLVKDFPFESPAHRSVWLAALLTPICRPAFEGPAPLFLIDSNVRGAGKTKLVHLISRILQGADADTMANVTDDVEMEKKIISIARAGDSITMIDDIGSMLGTPSLNAALTTTRFRGRTMQTQDMASYDLFTVWYATGNNVQVYRDMARRIAHLRLRSNHQNPEYRQLPDILREATVHRIAYLQAAHTLILAWIAAGRPQADLLKGWGSFDGWNAMVRQIVVWCGEPDPGETREAMAGHADVEGNALEGLIRGWKLVQDAKGCPDGLTVKMLLDHLEFNRSMDELDELRNAIDLLCPGGKNLARQLSIHLSHLRDRVVDGRCLSHSDKRGKGGYLWTVRVVEEGAQAVDPPAPTPP